MPKSSRRNMDASLVKIRGAAQITLPGAIRKTLKVREGDYLEASLTKGGVFLRPVVVVARAAARKRIAKIRRIARHRSHKKKLA